jgi:hypothetical protein
LQAGGFHRGRRGAETERTEIMDIAKVTEWLEKALRSEFEQVGVTDPVDVGRDEDTVVVSLSGDQAQALLDALNRAEDHRSR